MRRLNSLVLVSLRTWNIPPSPLMSMLIAKIRDRSWALHLWDLGNRLHFSLYLVFTKEILIRHQKLSMVMIKSFRVRRKAMFTKSRHGLVAQVNISISKVSKWSSSHYFQEAKHLSMVDTTKRKKTNNLKEYLISPNSQIADLCMALLWKQ